MFEITKDNFEKEVLNSDKPVLIDFWAPWCAPCKIMEPTVEKVAEEMKDRIKVGKSNVDEEPDIAADLSVLNIPTLILFKGGKEVARMIGIKSREAIESKITGAIE